MNRFSLSFSLLLSLSSSAWALDLVEAYQMAQKTDPSLASATATYEAAAEMQPQALSYLLPTIGLTGSADQYNNNVNSPAGGSDRQTSSTGWSLRLDQSVFDWQRWISYDQSKLSVLQSAASLEDARQNLILRVAQAYFDVTLAKEALILTQMQKSAILEQLESAKKRFEVGSATITDTNEAQASYDTILAEEIRNKTDLDNKRYVLQLLVGQPFDDVYLLRSDLPFPEPTPADVNHWVDAAKSEAWLVKYHVLNDQIAQKQIDYARAGHYPTVGFVASRGWDRSTAPVGYSGHTTANDARVGLTVTVPIFQGGYISSKVREAEALSKKADRDLAAAQRDAQQDARQYYMAVTSGRAEVSALEQALKSDEIALESNKLGYEVGARINLDVLNAQSKVYLTRRSLADARINLLLSQLALKASVGDLKIDDLIAVADFLNKIDPHGPK